MNYAFPTLGAAIAIAGSDKLAGYGGYDKMFRHLGWSRTARQAVSSVETAGGLLMVAPGTRRLGGLLVTAVSAALLASEMRHGDIRLALPRAVVMAAGLAALLVPKQAAG